MSAAFGAKDPDFAGRVRRSFDQQSMMTTIGALLERVEPGSVDVAVPAAPHILQQHGFIHGGAVSTLADTACGFAALSLVRPGVGVLTVEFKMNMMAPATGTRLIARGRVVKAGRTLIVTQADIFAETDGSRRAIALMTATIMAVEGRDGIVD